MLQLTVGAIKKIPEAHGVLNGKLVITHHQVADTLPEKRYQAKGRRLTEIHTQLRPGDIQELADTCNSEGGVTAGTDLTFLLQKASIEKLIACVTTGVLPPLNSTWGFMDGATDDDRLDAFHECEAPTATNVNKMDVDKSIEETTPHRYNMFAAKK